MLSCNNGRKESLHKRSTYGRYRCSQVFHEQTSKKTTIVTTLLTLILTLSNFIFNGLHFLQKMGCPMGTKCAPNYANIFMDDFEEKHIYPFTNQYSTLYLRCIDDVFMLWKGTKEQLDNFNKDLTEKHPAIEFAFQNIAETSQLSWHNSLHCGK